MFISRLDAKNLTKAFERKYKLKDYQVIRPQLDPVDYVKDNLQLGSSYKHVLTIMKDTTNNSIQHLLYS